MPLHNHIHPTLHTRTPHPPHTPTHTPHIPIEQNKKLENIGIDKNMILLNMLKLYNTQCRVPNEEPPQRASTKVNTTTRTYCPEMKKCGSVCYVVKRFSPWYYGKKCTSGG